MAGTIAISGEPFIHRARYYGAMARVAILTASDKGASGERDDTSGELIAKRCEAGGHVVVARLIVSDDRDSIPEALISWAEDGIADLVVTTGGTGLSPRDVTPEATRDVAERDVPGIPVALALE